MREFVPPAHCLWRECRARSMNEHAAREALERKDCKWPKTWKRRCDMEAPDDVSTKTIPSGNIKRAGTNKEMRGDNPSGDKLQDKPPSVRD